MAAPNIGTTGTLGSALIPIKIITSTGTLQLNSGSAVSAGATITGTLAFSGLLADDEFVIDTTKNQVAALQALGVTIMNVRCTSAGNVSVDFYCPNAIAAASIPAAVNWYCAVLRPGFMGQNLT